MNFANLTKAELLLLANKQAEEIEALKPAATSLVADQTKHIQDLEKKLSVANEGVRQKDNELVELRRAVQNKDKELELRVQQVAADVERNYLPLAQQNQQLLEENAKADEAVLDIDFALQNTIILMDDMYLVTKNLIQRIRARHLVTKPTEVKEGEQ